MRQTADLDFMPKNNVFSMLSYFYDIFENDHHVYDGRIAVS